MSSTVKAITDVNLSKEDVVNLVEQVYAPIQDISTSRSDGNVLYIMFADETTDHMRQMQIGLNGTFRCDDVNCEGLDKDFVSKVSFSIGYSGDSENILKKILSAVGGYYVDENDIATHIEKTENILDLDEDAILSRRSEVWARNTVATLGLPESATDDFVGKLQEIYIDAKAVEQEKDLTQRRQNSPEM